MTITTGMARKRAFNSVDVASIGDDEEESFEADEPVNVSSDSDCKSDSDGNVDLLSEGDDSTDSEDIHGALYVQYVREHKKLSKLKARIRESLKHKDKKIKTVKKQKDAFTRFSVSYFSRVITSLSPERKKIIEGYGFGSLLKFERCFVPNKFAQWVARQINYKTGDIVVKPNIIPFTRDSVHYVLGLPIGTCPFPKDSSVGKSILLSKFNLNSVPSVKFFGNKLMSKDEVLTDEDVFICFILVALNCFLCPNSSLAPSSKYLGIFENLENVGNLEWSKFILDWSLEAVKTFNKAKGNKDHDPPCLGGCLYLFAVYYLDFVDFGHRQVPHGLPRIQFWKNSMIKELSDLDEISPGIFGFRPVLDISKTCYSKEAVFLHNNPCYSSFDSNFLEKLDENSRCILPEDLKVGICNLLEQHSLKCALSLNMQVSSLSSLSNEMKTTFATLMEHCYSVDSRAQELVLKLLKLLTEYEPAKTDEPDIESNKTSPHLSNASMSRSQKSVDHSVQEKAVLSPEFNQLHTPRQSIYPTASVQKEQDILIQDNDNHNSCVKNVDPKSCQVPSVTKSCLKHSALRGTCTDLNGRDMNQNSSTHSVKKFVNGESHVALQKLSKTAAEHKEIATPSKSVMPKCQPNANSSPVLPSANKKHKSRIHLINDYVTDTDIASLRNPIVDVDAPFDEVVLPKKKSVKFLRDNGERDVIYLDNPNEFVSEFSTPPSPRGPSRYVFDKKSTLEENEDQNCTPQTPMTMVTLEDSPVSQERVTPLLSQSQFLPAIKRVSDSLKTTPSSRHKDSPDCEILGQKNVFQKATEMNKKAEDLYNSSLHSAHPNSSKLGLSSSKGKQDNCFEQQEEGVSDFKSRLSSTGGKLPHYGPRRPIYPTNRLGNVPYVARSKFRVTESEMRNYKAIMKLGDSEFHDVFAVHIGGVKCTYRSLRDSLKPGGFVNSFVVNVFCRHLFMKPHGHPDFTKKHIFFSTIADNLLKHPDDADQEVLQRAFTKSTKARPLPDSNLLFFPTLFENHWSVFVVDIKDNYFVFLDSFYNKDDQYQDFLRDRLIPSFQLHWDKYVVCDKDMKFDQYRVIYPAVPQQPEENLVDSGIIVLMILENWESPRTVLSSIFDLSDIPKIRVKIANELMFFPQNNGATRHLLEYVEKENEK
ncbi:hypothetical protein ACP70R_029137 [Stipagrostis hirtigluma subsp. patula]